MGMGGERLDWANPDKPDWDRAPDYLSTGQVSTILSVGISTVDRWRRSGLLPVASTTLGGHNRYSKESVRKVWERMHDG